MSGVNPVSYCPVPSLRCTVSSMEDLCSLSLRNTHTNFVLSGLAAKQLSAFAVLGSSRVEAQEMSTSD